MVLNNAIVSCTESIEKHKGKLVVKEAARAVSFNILFICFFYPLFISAHVQFDYLLMMESRTYHYFIFGLRVLTLHCDSGE